MTGSSAKVLPRVIAAAGVFGGVTVGGLAGNIAGSHTRDSGHNTVAQTTTNCVQMRGELKHTGNLIRAWGKVRSYKKGVTPNPCAQPHGTHIRLKLESIRQAAGGGIYTPCWVTIGDGLGDPGYVHSESGNSWEMGKVMVNGDGDQYFLHNCGNGNYRVRSTGHAQNNGWFGGTTWSPEHEFNYSSK